MIAARPYEHNDMSVEARQWAVDYHNEHGSPWMASTPMEAHLVGKVLRLKLLVALLRREAPPRYETILASKH